MANLNITNGVLDIKLIAGDEFDLQMTFNIPLTGYSFVSYVENLATSAKTTLTVVLEDLPAGKIRLQLNSTPAIPIGKHRWALKWTTPAGIDRTVLGGVFEVARV